MSRLAVAFDRDCRAFDADRISADALDEGPLMALKALAAWR
jgi:hypothetical protein